MTQGSHSSSAIRETLAFCGARRDACVLESAAAAALWNVGSAGAWLESAAPCPTPSAKRRCTWEHIFCCTVVLLNPLTPMIQAYPMHVAMHTAECTRRRARPAPLPPTHTL